MIRSLFANAVPRQVVDFGVDPHNPARGAVHDAWLRLHGFVVNVVAGGDTDPSSTFAGAVPSMQNFIGLSTAGATAQTIRNGGMPDISSPLTEGPETDPVRRIFADRLRRGANL
jgi:hypothetical protein